MATTVVFVEILIIGLQALIWFVLFFIALVDLSWISLNTFKGWENLTTLLILAFSYTLGIIVDRIADTLFSPLDNKICGNAITNKTVPVWKMRLFIMTQDNGITKYLEYIRSRLRIARSTTLNIALIIISFIVNNINGLFGQFNWITVFGVFVGIAVVTLSFFSWRSMTRNYYERLSQAYGVSIEKKLKK
ncbi:MAG: hypothetical protein J0L96_09080 [Anaerolineae bacterium]|nr:hypothetical protein [Anaerolineae bacterium]